MNRHPQPPSTADVKRLRESLERKRRTEDAAERALRELHVVAYDVCEVKGASRAEVGKALGVGKSTVHGWVNRGRQLRDR